MPTISGAKLNNALGQFTRRYAPAFITLILLGGAFFYYTRVVMQKNREDLLARSFRGLQSIGSNIRSKIGVYAEQNSQHFLRDMDSLKIINSPDTAVLEKEYGLTFLKRKPGDEKLPTVTIGRAGQWKIFFTVDDSLQAVAQMTEFVQSLLRRDLFSQYFLAYDKYVVFDELNMSHDTIPAIWKGREIKDTATKEKLTEYSVVELVETGGKKYRLFHMPFTVQGTHHFVIGGYMPLEEYNARSTRIMGIFIMWLVFGIVIVVLMFPLLRIFLMNRSERLNARDVLNSYMSIHLLASILTIILVNLYVYWAFLKPRSDQTMQDLAGQMQTNFLAEVGDALTEITEGEKELIRFVQERTRPGEPTAWPDLYRFNPNDTEYSVLRTGNYVRGESDPYKTQYLRKKYPYFEHLIWTDSSGQQIIRWTNKKMVPHKVNVFTRDYFQAVMQGGLFRRDTTEYYLSAIKSWVADEKLVSIARRSHLPSMLEQTPMKDTALKKQLLRDLSRPKVVSLNAPLRSLFNPILPYGYGFCLVNEAGDVLVHNDLNRSLNENLLHECNEDMQLESLLNTNATGFFNASYSGTNTRFYVQPIKGMPYYLVTWFNREILWNQDLDIVSATAILVLLNLALILLLVLTARILKIKAISKAVFFIWLEPKLDRHEAYRKVSAAFGVMALALLLFILIENGPDRLYLIGVSLGWTYIMVVYSYIVYNYSDWKKSREQRGWYASFSDFLKLEKYSLGILAGVYLASCSIFLINLNKGIGLFLFTQVACMGGLVFIERTVHRWTARQNGTVRETEEGISVSRNRGRIPNQRSFEFWYHCSVYGFMAATAIMPAILFFSLICKEEQQLVLKYQQLDFVNNFLHRKPFDFYKQDSIPRLSYHFPVHYNYVADSLAWDKRTDQLKKENTRFGDLYNIIKPSFSSYAKRTEYLADTAGGKFAWDIQSFDTLKFRMDVNMTGTFARSDPRIFAAKHLPTVLGAFGAQSGKQIFVQLLWIAAVIFFFLGVLRWLLDALIDYTFFFGKTKESPLQLVDNAFSTQQDLKFRPGRMFIIGIINSGKYSATIKELKILDGKARPSTGKPAETAKIGLADIGIVNPPPKPDTCLRYLDAEQEVAEYDFSQLMKDGNEGKQLGKPAEATKTILIRHFDHRMNDFKVSKRKLEYLEYLLTFGDKRLIIFSGSHFDKMVLQEDDANNKPGDDISGRWYNIMSNFTVFYYKWPGKDAGDPVSALPPEVDQVDAAGLASTTPVERRQIDAREIFKCIDRRFEAECRHSYFLYSLYQPIITSMQEEITQAIERELKAGRRVDKIMTEQFDILSLKLQTLAHYYFLSLWQSLTRQDQWVLYDIACDGLINLRNRDVAENLHALGILKINSSTTGYAVMNESFRQFVLTRIEKREIMIDRGGQDPAHSWNRFQLPVILVVVAVSVFLFTTQRDAFNNLTAWLGAAASAIAILLRGLDMLSGPKAAETGR